MRLASQDLYRIVSVIVRKILVCLAPGAAWTHPAVSACKQSTLKYMFDLWRVRDVQ